MTDQVEVERARIALEEYKVLHAEILQRDTVLNQTIAAGATVIAGVIGIAITGHLRPMIAVALGSVVVALVIFVWRLIDSDCRNASKRIIEIEEYVNGIVGGDDKNPLSWERRYGLLSRGYKDRLSRFDFDRR